MRYDLIIVGGGLVGAGLAVALKRHHWRIALVDARLPSNNDPRLFALNASSCQFLENVGVWSSIAALASAIRQVHVSNKGRFGAVRLHCDDVSLPSLGHVVPAYVIETALNAELTHLPNLTVYRPATLKSLTQTADMVSLTLTTETGDTVLEAPFVIGADGTESTVRSQLQIEASVTDYEQSAIVLRTSLQRSHHQIAYERFNAEGAIAMLPLVNDECATIWSANKVKAEALLALSDAEFLAALQKEFGYRLGALQRVGQRYHYPLRSVTAANKVEGRVLLLGNAAHTLHPIAAQGLNLALYEVASLVESLNEDSINLQHISLKISQQQATSTTVSHHLAQLFSRKSRWLSALLPLAMVGFDVATPLKKQFVNSIIGRSGSVPHLLLSENEI